MTLKYKVVSTCKPGEGKDAEKIYFPKLTGSSAKSTEDVAHILSRRSSLSAGDVHSVIIGLVDLIPELLLDGYTVQLDNFGSFRLHAKTQTEALAEKVTARHVKELRMSYTPSKNIKEELKHFSLRKAK